MGSGKVFRLGPFLDRTCHTGLCGPFLEGRESYCLSASLFASLGSRSFLKCTGGVGHELKAWPISCFIKPLRKTRWNLGRFRNVLLGEFSLATLQ